ncbi:MAG: hypothetical protein IKB30_06220 [Clostridia bacterium]|nr:hypothetical protein [Clostridia bacterium]MBR2449694.1 hypothetical protein [Clostridia bacterium]
MDKSCIILRLKEEVTLLTDGKSAFGSILLRRYLVVLFVFFGLLKR